MVICCLDMEGVLVPEIWIEVAKKTGIEALKLTTRDEPDYDKLMKRRLKILKDNDIRLKDIQRVISRMSPLPGARSFLDALRREAQVLILSDTFYEFAMPLMSKLGDPALFCNWLKVDRKGFVSGYVLRQKDGKTKAVKALRQIGFKVKAAGDSYNDTGMLKAAHEGIFFCPPRAITKQFPQFPVTTQYKALLKLLLKNA